MKGHVTVLILGVAAVLSAGAAAPAHSDDASVVTAEMAQSFRESFNVAMDNLDVVFDRAQSTKGRRLVADAKQKMQQVSDQDISRTFARGGVPDLAPFVAASRRLAGAVDRSGTRPRAQVFDPSTAGFPGAPGILGDCGNISHGPSFTYGALIAMNVARAIIAAAQFACEEVVVVLGEGGNGAAVCIPLAIAAQAAEVPFDLATFCGGEEDSALLEGSYNRLEHVHGDLDAARNQIVNDGNSHTTEILSNNASNTLTILTNDNTNTSQILNNSNSNTTNILASLGANADLAEAREIEDNLSRDACNAWMFTPEYADVARTIRLGGRLEKVAAVIQHAIDNARAIQSVRRGELECAQDSLDDALAKAGRRPPFRAEKVCDHLLDAYEKVTPSLKSHDHGYSDKDHNHHNHSHAGRRDGGPGISANR